MDFNRTADAEVIYQRALEIEFTRTGILFHREFEMPIIYKNEHIGTRRVGFLVEETISVELKAIIKLGIGPPKRMFTLHKPLII